MQALSNSFCMQALFLHSFVDASTSWGIILDCGSSGTRLRIYTWTDTEPIFGHGVKQFTPPKSQDEELLETSLGISSFAPNPQDVKPYIKTLFEQALRWIPSPKVSATRVRALATAGMRLLSDMEQKPIWLAIEEAISETNFAYTAGDSQTISGEYEGIFGWLSVNYILEQIGERSPRSFYGQLDLGGASTQITFPPVSKVILAQAYRVLVHSSETRVYSQSYMRSGQDQSMQRYAQLIANRDGSAAAHAALNSPCFNLGLNLNYSLLCGGASCMRLLVGTGNYTACRKLTDALLNLEYECLLSPCAAHGVYQPSPLGVAFFAVSAFFFTANGIGLLGWNEQKSLSTAQVEDAGAAWCSRKWSEVASKYASSFCFSSAYIPSLLDAYAVSRHSTTAVKYARKIHGFSTGWTLGAQLYFLERQKCTISEAGDPLDGGPVRGGHSECSLSVLSYQVMLGVGIPAALFLGLILGGFISKYSNKKICVALPQASYIEGNDLVAPCDCLNHDSCSSDQEVR